MRVKVEATTSLFDNNGDKIIEKYPFLKDPRFKLERVTNGKRESFLITSLESGDFEMKARFTSRLANSKIFNISLRW